MTLRDLIRVYLRKGEAEQFIDCMVNQGVPLSNLDNIETSPIQFVCETIVWGATPQGYYYWRDIHLRVRREFKTPPTTIECRHYIKKHKIL
jgi:hypothetical protein